MNELDLLMLEDISINVRVENKYLYIYTEDPIFECEKSAFIKRALIYALDEFVLNLELLEEDFKIVDGIHYFGITVQYEP